MAQETAVTTQTDIREVVKKIIDSIEREREREIISRRFGLYDRRETLEQIGELLGITRERVRQIEKAVMNKLQDQSANLPELESAEQLVLETVRKHGGASRVKNLSELLLGENTSHMDHAHVTFIAMVSPSLEVLDENDSYHLGVIDSAIGKKSAKQHIDDIVKTIKTHGKPTDIDSLSKKTTHESAEYVESLSSLSKHLAELKGQWGHIKWPTVNPKNIRDKIYVVLKESTKPMHFSEIAEAIKESDFKRKDVTVQAIHNELIKDKRFVLIGRGIYALAEWGFKKGTVSDIIKQVLTDSGEALHRDEIIKRVLDKRQVKETTILLNLQGKPLFKRVAKATYGLAD